jgi:hypothetical protein
MRIVLNLLITLGSTDIQQDKVFQFVDMGSFHFWYLQLPFVLLTVQNFVSLLGLFLSILFFLMLL